MNNQGPDEETPRFHRRRTRRFTDDEMDEIGDAYDEGEEPLCPVCQTGYVGFRRRRRVLGQTGGDRVRAQCDDCRSSGEFELEEV